MRKRKQIIKDSMGNENQGRVMWTPPEVLETLLDIRDLLTKENILWCGCVQKGENFSFCEKHKID